jgi:hypothetical protein
MKLGTVLIFKDDVTREEAAKALDQIADLLEPCWYREETPNRISDTPARAEHFNAPYSIQSYDSRYGGPVWYIP